MTAADSQLASVLKKEIEIESTAESEPEDTKWLEKSGFKLVVKDGSDEVELVKKEGGEIIHVFFSVSDITNGDAYDFNEEGFEGEANEGEGEEDLPIDVPPIRANIVVEKGTSALTIESVIQSNLCWLRMLHPMSLLTLLLPTLLTLITYADLFTRGLHLPTLMRVSSLLLSNILTAEALMLSLLASFLTFPMFVRTRNTFFGSTRSRTLLKLKWLANE